MGVEAVPKKLSQISKLRLDIFARIIVFYFAALCGVLFEQHLTGQEGA